jgi:hypothetical protein
VTSAPLPRAPTADTTEASAAPVRVPATPSREPISAAVTAAAVLATIWMTDRPNLLSPSWSPIAVVAADPEAAAVPVVAAVAGVIFWVAGSGVTRREAGERPGTGVRSCAFMSEVSRVRCRLPVVDPSVGRCGPTAHQRQPSLGRPGPGSGSGPVRDLTPAPPTGPRGASTFRSGSTARRAAMKPSRPGAARGSRAPSPRTDTDARCGRHLAICGFRIEFVTALAALPDRPAPVATSPQP